ncbi:MAG: hypothetical protein UHO61_02175 [Acutalibacteraceae bacterium]|nr:hypothetical protein [Acutalibacteraceae bacterium]
MRRGKVLSLKNFKFMDFLVKNNILTVLVILITAGVAVGIFTESKLELLSNYSASYLERFTALRTGESFISVAVSSFMGSALILLAVFTTGTSMLGVVLVPLLALLKGVLYGAVSALLYSEYAIKGIAFNAILIVPSAFIFVIAFLFAARESMRFSLLMAKISLPGATSVNLAFDFKNYCGRYLLIILIVLASALTDAVLSCSFLEGLML